MLTLKVGLDERDRPSNNPLTFTMRVGTTCEVGHLLAINRRGNLRPWKHGMKGPVGVAITKLIRGHIVEMTEKGTTFDPQLVTGAACERYSSS